MLRKISFKRLQTLDKKQRNIIIGLVATLLLLLIGGVIYKQNQIKQAETKMSNSYANKIEEQKPQETNVEKLKVDEKLLKENQQDNNSSNTKNYERPPLSSEVAESNIKKIGEFDSVQKNESKPNDMVSYLKQKQGQMTFNQANKFVLFEGNSYVAGDKFKNWWEIEEINSIYVRFKDSDYAYNLRFLGY